MMLSGSLIAFIIVNIIVLIMLWCLSIFDSHEKHSCSCDKATNVFVFILINLIFIISTISFDIASYISKITK